MWFAGFIRSSIGKKFIMAASGGLLLLFLLSHAAGNSTIFLGIDFFQSYADQLHSHPLLVSAFSTGLTIIFIIHILTGFLLFLGNRKSASRSYRIRKRAQTANNANAAATMIYSGLVVLLFIVIHTASVSFGDHSVIGATVSELFSSFFISIFYIVSFIALATHLSHGIWSMLQTLGFNHPKYNTFINTLTYTAPLFFLLLFGSIPLIFLFR